MKAMKITISEISAGAKTSKTDDRRNRRYYAELSVGAVVKFNTTDNQLLDRWLWQGGSGMFQWSHDKEPSARDAEELAIERFKEAGYEIRRHDSWPFHTERHLTAEIRRRAEKPSQIVEFSEEECEAAKTLLTKLLWEAYAEIEQRWAEAQIQDAREGGIRRLTSSLASHLPKKAKESIRYDERLAELKAELKAEIDRLADEAADEIVAEAREIRDEFPVWDGVLDGFHERKDEVVTEAKRPRGFGPRFPA